MGIPPPGFFEVVAGRHRLQKPLLCTEIERVGRSVWICKLFHKYGTARSAVFQRVTVEGNRTEAQRVMTALYELQKIKEEG